MYMNYKETLHIEIYIQIYLMSNKLNEEMLFN